MTAKDAKGAKDAKKGTEGVWLRLAPLAATHFSQCRTMNADEALVRGRFFAIQALDQVRNSHAGIGLPMW